MIPHWIQILVQRQNLTVDEQINSRTRNQQQQTHQMVQNGISDYNGLSSLERLPLPQGYRTEGGKREFAGTGVFLPRHTNAEADERRKPGWYEYRKHLNLVMS